MSEVICAGLRLLEDEESKAIALRNAIQKGLESQWLFRFMDATHIPNLR